MNAIEYLKEKKRMLDSLGRVNDSCIGVNCEECPFSFRNNGKKLLCGGFELEHLEEAVTIVQKWSQEHPRKTILQDLLEKYPSTIIDEVNEIPTMCPHQLGYEYTCDDNCIDCWNRPLE